MHRSCEAIINNSEIVSNKLLQDWNPEKETNSNLKEVLIISYYNNSRPSNYNNMRCGRDDKIKERISIYF